MSALTHLEQSVLHAILDGAHPVLEVLREQLPGLGLAAGTAVVAICLSAHRSPPAVRLLQAAGFEARQLEGGMVAWSSAGLPVVRR